MIYGLVMIPIFAVMGLAFDFQRANHAKSAIREAVDASTLAAARQLQMNYNDTEKVIDTGVLYFEKDTELALSDLQCETPDVSIDQDDFGVRVKADCKLPTTFAGIVGLQEWTLSAEAAALSSNTTLDLALMLDVSGSMQGTRIQDLRAAAHQAVDVVLNTGKGGRVALAPYASSVNAGAFAAAAVGPDYDPDRSEPNCVTERKGKAKKKDDPPGPGTYIGYDADTCPAANIVPLSDDADKLHAAIDALTPGGNTAGQLGIAWSWYAVAHAWADFWPDENDPRDPSDPNVIKAVILMTDGEFNQSYDSTQGNSINQSKVMCKSMRDEGIIIYSVAFQAPAGGKSVLQDCASSDDTYFEAATGAELLDVYTSIALQLNQLRLTN